MCPIYSKQNPTHHPKKKKKKKTLTIDTKVSSTPTSYLQQRYHQPLLPISKPKVWFEGLQGVQVLPGLQPGDNS